MSTEMFIYLKRWARQIAWEIYNENQNEFRFEKHDKLNSVVFLTYDKAQSVIMESMWRNK